VRNSQFANVLAALCLSPAVVCAQGGPIPGRDLLTYPVGLVAEAGALPGMLGIGLFNPAATRLPSDTAWRVAVASMNTPADLSATAQAGGVSGLWRKLTLSASVLRASVDGLVRTESDPLPIGNDISYYTQVFSLAAAGEVIPKVSWGAALRMRSGQIEFEKRRGASIDVGVVADGFTPIDLRFGAATFLWSPFASSEEPPTLLLAADARVAGANPMRTARVGASVTSTSGRSSEQFAFGSLRFDAWELRGGPVRSFAYGTSNTRARIALGVRYGGYSVGVAREGSPSGLAPTYQFVLSALLK
jgi:hypothetical protein